MFNPESMHALKEFLMTRRSISGRIIKSYLRIILPCSIGHYPNECPWLAACQNDRYLKFVDFSSEFWCSHVNKRLFSLYKEGRMFSLVHTSPFSPEFKIFDYSSEAKKCCSELHTIHTCPSASLAHV
jgi:hypothetical protein